MRKLHYLICIVTIAMTLIAPIVIYSEVVNTIEYSIIMVIMYLLSAITSE